MEIKYGEGKTKQGPGVNLVLDGDEIARAIDTWLLSQEVVVRGPRTIRIDGEVCRYALASIYVDPSGFVIHEGERYSGRGEGKDDYDYFHVQDLRNELSKKDDEIERLKMENAENAVMYRNVMRELCELREKLAKEK